MHNPFKTPEHEDNRPTANAPHINALLLLLSVVTAYILTKDIYHLLSINNSSLENAASISIFHYIYLKAVPFEIAYFRVTSTITTLIFILFAARNSQIFAKHYFLIIVYGATQLIYQILAISGVIEILTQSSGRNALDTNFWLDSAMISSTIQVLSGFLLVIAPPIIFIALCFITRARINQSNDATHISN